MAVRFDITCPYCGEEGPTDFEWWRRHYRKCGFRKR